MAAAPAHWGVRHRRDDGEPVARARPRRRRVVEGAARHLRARGRADAAARRVRRGGRHDQRIRRRRTCGRPDGRPAGRAARAGLPRPRRDQVHLRHRRLPAHGHGCDRAALARRASPRRSPHGCAARRRTASTARSTPRRRRCAGSSTSGLLDRVDSVDAAIDGAADDSVLFVPALAGLAAPWWRSDATASFSGITLGTSRADLVASGAAGYRGAGGRPARRRRGRRRPPGAAAARRRRPHPLDLPHAGSGRSGPGARRRLPERRRDRPRRRGRRPHRPRPRDQHRGRRRRLGARVHLRAAVVRRPRRATTSTAGGTRSTPASRPDAR